VIFTAELNEIMMETKLIILLSAITISFLVIGVKNVYGKRLRNKHQVNIRTGIFRLYSQEQIYTTHSERKKDFMVFSNGMTVVLFISILVIGMSLLVFLYSWISVLPG
jgi:hypothetical protein